MKSRLRFIRDAILHSYSKVFFAENRLLGLILLAVSFIDPWSGLVGVISVLTVVLLSRWLGYNLQMIRNGAYGYNALLVGLGIGLYFQPGLYILFVAVVFAILTFFLTLNIQGILYKYGLPFLSIPFLLSMWLVSLSIFSLEQLGLSERWIYVYNDLYRLGGEPVVRIYESIAGMEIPFFWRTYFLSLGAIFFQMSTIAGIIIAIGLLIYSRIVFLLSLVGFTIAFYSFEILHIDLTQLSYTYIGFNFILTAIAAGGYYVMPSRTSFLSLLFLMPFSVFFSLAAIKIFAPYHLPLYSLPFNVVVLIYLYALKLRQNYTSAGLIEPLYPKATPEYTLYDFQNNMERFHSLTYFPVFLPVQGFWYISQAHNGTYTHKGDWRFAWDFVQIDEKGNQFKNTGDLPEDYYCYGKPVVAPADGTVVKVIRNVEDNKIGEVNIRENWGNVIVIKHTDYLYSLLAHLKHGSIKVKEGDYVRRGQIIAQVGNSGRSPYPHLHFQFQAQPYVGAPTIDYPLAYYIRKQGTEFRMHKYDRPKEGDIIGNVVVNDLMFKKFNFVPGQRLNVKVLSQGKEKEYLWQIETTPTNTPYIYCPETNSYAYFHNDGTAFFMLDFHGNKHSPLFYFYLATYKMILSFYKKLEIKDSVPIYLIYNKRLIMVLQDFIAPFYQFIRGKYSLKYVEQNLDFTDETILLESIVNLEFPHRNYTFLHSRIKIMEDKTEVTIATKKSNMKMIIT